MRKIAGFSHTPKVTVPDAEPLDMPGDGAKALSKLFDDQILGQS